MCVCVCVCVCEVKIKQERNAGRGTVQLPPSFPSPITPRERERKRGLTSGCASTPSPSAGGLVWRPYATPMSRYPPLMLKIPTPLDQDQVTKFRTFQNRMVKPSHFNIFANTASIFVCLTEMILIEMVQPSVLARTCMPAPNAPAKKKSRQPCSG